jgi:hypothetical protein
MNQRACILALTVCTFCTVSMSSHSAIVPVGAGDVPVNGVPNIFAWGDPATAGAGNVSSIGNRLLYTTVGSPTTSSPNPDFASLNWLNYKDVPNGSWTFEVDVSMPGLSATLGDGQFVQYGLQAQGNPSTANLNLYLEQFESGGSLVRQFHAFSPSGVDLVSTLAQAPSDNDKLRFRFDGATQHLFAEFDRDANDGVDDWIPFGDLANFNLSSISLFGESGFIPMHASTEGPTIAAADGVGATVVPEPSASAVMLAGLAGLGWFGVRARRRARPGPT